MDRIRTAVVGAGKMGAVHAKVYDQLPQSDFVGVVDIDAERAERLARQYGCTAFTDCREIVGKVDAVTIATPTVTHQELAEVFIESDVAVMVEKPLAADVEEGGKIVKLAKKRNTVVATGHSERCNPVVQAMKRLDIEPKFIEATRISPYPFRSTDIGVVLDVMIHDIDIILSLAASRIRMIDAVGVNVIGEKEDICNARIRVFSRQAYLSVDYFKKSGVLIKADPNVNVVNWIKERQDAGDFDLTTANWPDLLHIEQLTIDDKEPLRLEQEAFLKAVSDKTQKPEVSAEEGLAAMECAEKILASVGEHKWD
jgi:predicted dehydrogenase